LFVNRRWILLTVAALFIFSPPCAFALKVKETDDYYVYFPEEAGLLAARIASLCSPMAAFLEEQGLPINHPIHIILDQNLDQPKATTQLYPHREIRLPMRAPGVFEDGYTQSDPWQYFLFKGFCVLGIYNIRSGLPAGAYRLFGEIISPNAILPDWTIDGISHLLYERYTLGRVSDPIAEAIINAGTIPSLDRVSHHPEIWPGEFSYRIYGRPFIRWLSKRFGWAKILHFLQLHGRGILPIEIDLKAKDAFGMSWNQLWNIFQSEHIPEASQSQGIPIVGYWQTPYYYWNNAGVYPGIVQSGKRSRYGFVDGQSWLWLSEYIEGVSKIKIYQRGTMRNVVLNHVWDPGPGSVAVTRHFHTPSLILFGPRIGTTLMDGIDEVVPIERKIQGPAGVLQMSGPVMDEAGRIAVAANFEGNWDIWIYDDKWHRVTETPSVETDPWWIDGKLIFSSNTSGTFQVYNSDMEPLTRAANAALLPRGHDYLDLDAAGWQRRSVDTGQAPPFQETFAKSPEPSLDKAKQENEYQDYSAWKSLWPNYIGPDYFFNIDDFQLGLSTKASDVSRAYTWNAGVRYNLDDEKVTWLLGYHAKQFRTRATQYPLSYATQRETAVDQQHLEIKVSWSPLVMKEMTLAANWRYLTPEYGPIDAKEDWWASISWKDQVGSIYAAVNLDAFIDGSQSLYGELLYWYGEKVNTIIRFRGGKSWGDLNPGRNTFRLGGNSGEGHFTQRSSRLFALRGFDTNIIEAGQAASASLDILRPFAKLQSGYKTLPLFLHNITIGTFIDAGFAANHFTWNEILLSAGIEIITGMQLAWESKSNLSIGLAWPLKKPSDIEQDGPTILILIGQPL
jgi:hypothetical protein